MNNHVIAASTPKYIPTHCNEQLSIQDAGIISHVLTITCDRTHAHESPHWAVVGKLLITWAPNNPWEHITD